MIVLDTHALVFWVNGGSELSKAAKKSIEHELKEDGAIAVSAISAWEFSMLVKKDRLVCAMDVDAWLDSVAEIPQVRFVPVDRTIALRSIDLPGTFHSDPADRMIVATARTLSAPLVTRDEKIRAYSHVNTIW